MFLDPTYLIFMAPAFILMMLASWYVKSTYRKWSRIPSRMTGYEAAQRLISVGGLNGVQIEGASGSLTDHYDPRRKVLSLSRDVAGNASVASVAVALLFPLSWPLHLPISFGQAALLGLAVGIMAELGGLVASLFKRNRGVKDSGKALPGHGGFLDRTDSVLFVGVTVYYFAMAVQAGWLRF